MTTPKPDTTERNFDAVATSCHGLFVFSISPLFFLDTRTSLNSYPDNSHYIRAPDDIDVSGE